MSEKQIWRIFEVFVKRLCHITENIEMRYFCARWWRHEKVFRIKGRLREWNHLPRYGDLRKKYVNIQVLVYKAAHCWSQHTELLFVIAHIVKRELLNFSLKIFLIFFRINLGPPRFFFQKQKRRKLRKDSTCFTCVLICINAPKARYSNLSLAVPVFSYALIRYAAVFKVDNSLIIFGKLPKISY